MAVARRREGECGGAARRRRDRPTEHVNYRLVWDAHECQAQVVNMRTPIRWFLPLVPALTLWLMAACATPPTEKAYLRYAGPPIESFTYLGHYNGFRTLGGVDLVIWTSSDAYLIKAVDPCPHLAYANKVELTSEANTVTRSIDWVGVDHDRCRIDTIQRLDYGAMKRAGLAGP